MNAMRRDPPSVSGAEAVAGAVAGAELPSGWRFEDPRPRNSGARPHDYSALMAHPGAWVLINPHANTTAASNLAKAARKAHGGRWSACSRRNLTLANGKPTWRHYLRYEGPE